MSRYSRSREAGQEEFFTAKILRLFGFDDAAVYIYALVSSRFSTDSRAGFKERIQFVREELDAASQGDRYARDFAEWLEPNGAWYQGAMRERASYPVDGPGGPQMTLLASLLPLMRTDAETAMKLRCRIVKYVFDDMVALSEGRGDPDCLFDVDFYMQEMAPDYGEVRDRVAGVVLRIGRVMHGSQD
ncbi:MAG: hypothetical protein K6E40_03135 [Desulfovibrio sp.]|nr:hypothetical protein [Desulfovibrio sp.]